MMIQKKIKKWYPTKEAESRAKWDEINRSLGNLAERRDRIRRERGSHDYIVVGPEVATSQAHSMVCHPRQLLQNVQYGNMEVGHTTTESEPQQESVKPSTWQMFKEDFGEWKWSNFWNKLIIFSLLSLVFSISHRLIIGPIKLNNGSPCPFYLEVLTAQGLYLGTASLLWVLEKLWYIKAYITGFIKLGITLILILPLALVLSFLPMNYKETKSISEKITNFWSEKCFTKKESEIIEKYIKEL